MFQSLIGLKINWNIKLRIIDNKTEVFQSLIGLKINWNYLRFTLSIFYPFVSIPNRA